MSDMLSYALELSRMGFTVIPIHPKGKEPAISSWAEYQKEKPTESQIRRWWNDKPDANIAIVTGKASRVVVVDLDSSEHYEKFLEAFPTGFIAKTSQGYHLYYTYPSGYQDWLSGNPPIEKMDFRGDGGYVIAPPSIHSSGTKYEWVSLKEIGRLPADLVTLVKQRQQTPRVAAVFKNGLVPNHTVTNLDDHRWVSDLMANGSPNGSRNQDLARLAGYFFGKGLPEDLVTTMLLRWYEKTDKKDFPYEDFEKTIKSVKRSSEKTPLKNQIVTPSTITPQTVSQSVMSMGSFLSAGDEEVTWMIDDWLPEDTTGLMVSPPGCFKTWTMLAMGLSLSTGYPLFGKYKVNNPRRVLIIQQEDSKNTIRQRVRTIFAQMCIDAGVRIEVEASEPHLSKRDSFKASKLTLYNYEEPQLDIYTNDRLINLGDVEAMDLLEKLIDQNKYGAVFIDPMYSLGLEDDQFLSESAKRMIIFKQWRNKYRTSFFVLHHKKKSGPEDKSTFATVNARSEIWGSQFLNAWLETGIYLNRSTGMADNTVGISRTYKSAKAPTTVTATFDINTDINDMRFKTEIEKMEILVNPNTPTRYGTGTPVIPPDQQSRVEADTDGEIRSVMLGTQKGQFDIYPLFRDNVVVNSSSVQRYIVDTYGIKLMRTSIDPHLEKLVRSGKITKTAIGYDLVE